MDKKGEDFERIPPPLIRRRPARPLLAAGTAGALIAACLIGLQSSAASAATCSPNPVVCENAKEGSPSTEWDIDGAGDDTVQGFATDMSVNAGQTVRFKIRAEHAYTIAIYRLGYYGGDGARRVTPINGTFPAQNQETACVTDEVTQIYDCGTWAESASWAVPATAVSGVYIAMLKRTDSLKPSSHITFVVRDDSSTSDIIFKTSDATWQAYNTYGGTSFYTGPQGRATKLSYNRPFATRGAVGGRDFLFSTEYPTIRFLERNGYDVTYTTDVDADRRGGLLANHKVFLSVGHDEYWSGAERTAVESARDSGVNLAFFSGNEVYWRTRWETSKDGANTAHRTLVCYKETWEGAKTDPTLEWTGTWRDPRFSPPSNGGRPENALTGTMFQANSVDLTMQVPAAHGKNRFWRHTTVAELGSGTKATLAAHTVGYESDEDIDNGFRPAGLIRLSETTGIAPEYLVDFGKTVEIDRPTTHHMTLYRAPSGALVFGAGTIQYPWGLDDHHDSEYEIEPPDKRMQQAFVNLMADMRAQPATLMSTLQATTASTDTTRPTATITSPASGASLANGAKITATGTAADTGGVVAGVEVSLDGGTTWHPATGTTSWSYTGFLSGDGAGSVRVRATDDSANIGAVATRPIALTGSSTLFGSRVPVNASTNDSGAVELGVKVVPQTDGFIKGIRFYKGAGNTGEHDGTLWSVDGDLLASGTFTDETTTGWQTLVFSQAVPVVAGTTYVASYTAPNGRFPADQWSFSYTTWQAPPLSAPRSQDSDGNGVYGEPGEFPVRTYKSTNYYVDVLFNSSALTAPTVTTVTPTPNALYTPTSAHPTATFSKPINPATIQFTLTVDGGAVAGSVSYDATTKTATFNPAAPLAAGKKFTADVTASDPNGNVTASPPTWSFTTDPGSTTISRLFAATDTPAVTAIKDPGAISVGVRFTPSANGKVIGVRFFKGTGNGGTHTGSLWSATGGRLEQATFVAESSSGWQSVYFDRPVDVTAGTTYVASYFAPRGNYAVTSGFFNATWTNGPLSAPGGGNGVYLYGSDGFPTSSWSNSNYWVDPLFVAAPPQPQPQVPEGAITVFPPTAVPANPNWNDSGNVELGLRFTSSVPGQVNGVRFYKGVDNAGPHTATLWSSTGDPITTGTFVGETGSGWQTMLFDTPVTITANTEYVVSYRAPNGHYGLTSNGLAAPVVNGPLRSVANGGSYFYGAGFPANRVNHNYWVDVVFTPAN